MEFREYPKMLYRLNDGEQVIVQDRAEENALGKEYGSLTDLVAQLNRSKNATPKLKKEASANGA